MVHAMTHPQPQAFWDKIAPKYAARPVSDMRAYEAKLAHLASLFRPNDHVLEIGCGTGTTALKLADRVASYTATDVSGAMLDIARSKTPADGEPAVTFQRADAAEAVEGQPFDVICAFSLLHLVDDLPKTLSRVHAQLKPGGMFLSKTVCLKNSWIPFRPLIAVLRLLGMAPKVRFLNTKDCVRHLEDAGFQVEDVRYFTNNTMSPFILARRAQG